MIYINFVHLKVTGTESICNFAQIFADFHETDVPE